MSRRLPLISALLLLVCIGAGWWYVNSIAARQTPIRVGVLHSLTGTMAISEAAVVDATLLAIEEINQQGGLLGRPIEPVIVDGASDAATFARAAEQLIINDQVAVVFGCWTSASRKTVKPVFERYDHLLFYPVQYEGLEQSPNIVYTGAAPNQQIIPAVKWSLDNLGRRFFLVGSDYVFPRTANEIIKDQLTALNAEIVGEEYLLLGSTDVEAIIEKIITSKPDVILNTINGDSNIAFFRALRSAGIDSQTTPTVSFSIAEPELRSIDSALTTGDYAAWNYFQSVDSPENRAFVERFRARYGQDRTVSDPMEAAYAGVYLWAQAVTDAQSPAVSGVRQTIKKQSLRAPGGVMYIDPETQHTWKNVRIGQIGSDGQFVIVWNSGKPVRPVPFPLYRSASTWQDFLEQLYSGWGNSWANPGG
jgi:urea transport system substrate-binding protein